MWQVEWNPDALDELANGWVRASSAQRAQITAAAAAIDRRLSEDPFADSEARAGSRRIMFCPPLTVEYRVDRDSRIVTAAHIRVYQPRPR
jgi:hypothetical protein